jgi:deazaflavin-dependent oxidoreductase (nitroreductase family)
VWRGRPRPRTLTRNQLPVKPVPSLPTPDQFLYLTTRGRASGLPREIEIWFTHLNGRYYVIAEHPTSNWVQNLQADPEVQVRVAQENFPAQVRIVSPQIDPDLHRAVQELSRQKYGWGEGLIVELDPRESVKIRG